MIVVHELAHLARAGARQGLLPALPAHVWPDYHQYEFDLRTYLTYRDAGRGALEA